MIQTCWDLILVHFDFAFFRSAAKISSKKVLAEKNMERWRHVSHAKRANHCCHGCSKNVYRLFLFLFIKFSSDTFAVVTIRTLLSGALKPTAELSNSSYETVLELY